MPSKNRRDFLALDIHTLRLNELGGYLYFYKPDHPLAGQNGMVPLHRHVMSVQIKRWLTPNEVVVFINGDHRDTRSKNLMITTRSGLMKLNANHPAKVELRCSYCNNVYTESPSHVVRRHYCSRECAVAASRKFEISAEELEKLVWGMPTNQIAALLGVSDKAIEKRCKRLKISKPPRGHWAKLDSSQLDPIIEQIIKTVRRRKRSKQRRGH